jgi:SAM-dependent methyltransferase
VSIAAALRRLWSRFWLRGAHFRGGAYRRLDALYVAEDPWALSAPAEQERFERTNAIIASVAPDCRSLLELGSGEGYQTVHLVKVADRVTSLDVSRRAIRRAKRRAPAARFLKGRAEDLPALFKGERFDLVTACEMLYYAADPARILAAAQSLAPAVLATNYARFEPELAPQFAGRGWERLPDMEVGSLRWRCDLWRAPA